MRFPHKTPLLPVAAFAAISGLSSSAFAAAPACKPEELVNPVYGAGGSAITATLRNVAKALVSLPTKERITVLYSDPSACTGYNALVKPSATVIDYWYYKDTGAEGGPEFTSCSAPGNLVTFSHMGNTSLLCADSAPVPAGYAKFVAPVQSINFITSADSAYDSISAEAAYHVFGFGPGASGHDVAPWTVPGAVFGRSVSSFVHLLVASAINVPPTGFKLPTTPTSNFLSTNEQTVTNVFNWGGVGASQATRQQALGYVSGSAADLGQKAGQIKTLAFKDYDQTCGYLPDTSPTVKDKLNVRTGQYSLFTQGWFYTKLDDEGKPPADVAKIIHWFDGTLESPEDLEVNVGTAEDPKVLKSVRDIIIDSGDVPLCAMQVLRTDGDLSPIVSYASPTPCNGYFEKFATGTTEHADCDESSDCEGENEQCFWGFCEVTYPESTDPN